ncbi:MAG TPA: HAMP domain-containing protein, partial [Myxococcaceae bacterium]|nr:HAMP domain-containing protein [Myxococcaceae bacterium]
MGRLALGLVVLAPAMFYVGATREPTHGPVAWYLLGLALLLFGALLLYLEYVAAPLKRMSEASLRFANGDFSALVDEAGPPHARQLARSLNQMAKALALRYEHVAQTVQHSQEVLIALEMLAREQSEEVAKQNIALKAQAHELREHREVLATQNQVLSAQNEALQRASRHKSEFLA